MTHANKMLQYLFISALLLVSAVLFPIQEQAGPSMNDIERITCPSDRPFKCLPYGVCCRGSEFCHSGLCESCFPREVPKSGLLAWCRDTGQYNVSSMRSHACRLACQDQYTSLELAVFEDPGHEVSSPVPSNQGKSSSQDGKVNNATLTITDVVSPAFLRAKEQHTHSNSQGIVVLNVSVAEIFLIVFALLAGVVFIYYQRKTIGKKFTGMAVHGCPSSCASTARNGQTASNMSSCNGQTTHNASLVTACNGQTTSSTPLCNGQITSSTPLCNGQTSNNTSACNGQTTDNASACNGQTTSNTPSCNGQTTNNASACNGQTTSNTPSCNGQTTNNTSACNGQSTSNTPSCNGQTTNNASACNGQSTSNTPSCNGQTTNNASACNGQTTSNTPLCNGQTTNNASACNGQTTSNTPSCNGQTTNNTSACNGQSTSTTPSCNGQTSNNASACNGQTTNNASACNGQTTSDMSLCNGETPKNTTSSEQQSVGHTTSLDKQRDCDGQLQTKTENTVNEMKEQNYLNAEHTALPSHDSSYVSDCGFLKVFSTRSIGSCPNEAAGDTVSLGSTETDILVNDPTLPSQRESSPSPASQGPEFRTHSLTEMSRLNNVNASSDSSASEEVPRAEGTAQALAQNDPEDSSEETPLLKSGENDINLQEKSQLRKAK